uniref:Retrovirus-related Pol polyprotein from transposon TNT 1-94 n=1 Tax=Tanacetum cinerariifolium TaxID=118510 RepID=A0A6L2NY07_TANCI|nr:retrovirus-related Pol polyprotein from transposon TNT 1-94 [Tanacetum cinerariifolium]
MFLHALPLIWRAKVTTIKEAKDLATLPFDEQVGNLMVYAMILENDRVVTKATTKDKIKSLALKAKGNRFGCCNRFDNGTNRFGRGHINSFGNKGGESPKPKRACYSCRIEGHFASECRKPKDNMAFVGGAWSDSEDDDEHQNDATCLMAIDSQEDGRHLVYGSNLKGKVVDRDKSIDSVFARFNTIITSLKAFDEGYTSKNYVRKFLRALHHKWWVKVTTIGESKDLTSLSLDKLIGNLKVHEMIIKKDSKIVKEKVKKKYLALKVRKKYSDDECLTSGSEYEECGDPNHLIGECPKPPKDKNQRAFVGGSWSDSGEEDVEKVNNETCLVAQASSEACFESSYFSDENSSIDDLMLDNENDKLCKMSLKIITKNKRLKATRNNLEKELSVLKEKVSTLEKNKGVDLECVKWFNSFEASSSGTKEIKFVKAQKKTSSNGGPINMTPPKVFGCPPKQLWDFHQLAHLDLRKICLGVDLEPDEWIKDSGCSKHMSGNRNLFSRYKAYNGGNVSFGSNLCGNIIGKGYSQNSKAYIILNKHTRKVEESLNVTFDETPPPSKTSHLVDDDLDEEKAIKVTKKNLENDIEDETLEIVKIVIIKESRNHPLKTIIGNLIQRILRSQAQNQSNFFYFISAIEPKNINKALGDESWIVAMQEELNQFIANDVWELVPQLRNMTIIETKWVFRNKLDENGIVSQNKARLVAQGYNQQEGIDYNETYATIARLKLIRILLAYACSLDCELFQMDIKSAFLNGFINEEVYVTQPPGFIDFEKPDHVYKLKKALYGLKQKPKAWPYIMFSVCLYACFQEAPKTSYLEAVKRIFRYIKGSMHLGLWYHEGTGIETVVYADPDHARDYVDRKRTSGICTFVGCCLTSWCSKKQTALSISTTKAEYVSVRKACQQALWMKQALIDYDIRLDDVPIMCENKGVIDLSKNPVQHSQTKHIKIRHHFLCDNVQK